MHRPRLLAASLAVPLTVAACSSDENGADRADRQVTFEATDYTFPGLQGFSARGGHATRGQTGGFTVAS